jgi:TolA-binding protein
MKQLFVAGILAAAVLTALPATAQQPAPKSDPQTQAAPDMKTFDQQMAETQAQVKRMQDQMDRIGQTQDPQERQRLLQEHWATMQSAMTTMHGM